MISRKSEPDIYCGCVHSSSTGKVNLARKQSDTLTLSEKVLSLLQYIGLSRKNKKF